MRAKGTYWLILTVAAGMLTLSATAQAQVTKQKAKITSTERLEFGMRGLIQIVDSFGEVNVEGWDQPDVELTVNKTTQKQYEPKNLAKGMKELERIKIQMERVGESSLLVIKTTFPSRTPTRIMRGKTNLDLEYKIKIPRTSRLMIKHDIGEVVVSNIDGDIEATNRIGELKLVLPDTNQYSVDARVKIGDVSSEFGPTTQRQKLLGAKLDSDPPSSARRLFLRVGIGDIEVSKLKMAETDKKQQWDGAIQY